MSAARRHKRHKKCTRSTITHARTHEHTCTSTRKRHQRHARVASAGSNTEHSGSAVRHSRAAATMSLVAFHCRNFSSLCGRLQDTTRVSAAHTRTVTPPAANALFVPLHFFGAHRVAVHSPLVLGFRHCGVGGVVWVCAIFAVHVPFLRWRRFRARERCERPRCRSIRHDCTAAGRTSSSRCRSFSRAPLGLMLWTYLHCQPLRRAMSTVVLFSFVFVDRTTVTLEDARSTGCQR